MRLLYVILLQLQLRHHRAVQLVQRLVRVRVEVANFLVFETNLLIFGRVEVLDGLRFDRHVDLVHRWIVLLMVGGVDLRVEELGHGRGEAVGRGLLHGHAEARGVVLLVLAGGLLGDLVWVLARWVQLDAARGDVLAHAGALATRGLTVAGLRKHALCRHVIPVRVRIRNKI